MADLQQRIQEWLSPTFDQNTQETLQKMIDAKASDLEESFYKDLEFGTGGMRGIMGVGTNRINKYTLGKSTQGLSDYLLKQFSNEQVKVVIAYDCRNNSDTLARTVAEVFSANGIKVYLFSSLRTTPELSYAVKFLDCHAGIVLTASHNPPEYNGYKVYWQDGGQLVPPQDGEIIATIDALKYSDIKFDANEDLIELIDKSVDGPFVDASVKNGSFNTSQDAKDDLTIVFTSLHGTSIKSIPQTLEQAGYKNVHIVKEQAEPDGNFPTVKSPNPEEKAALKMATELAIKVGADILIGTDPDSDRLGIAVRDQNNEMVLLNGNQTMIVMVNFLLEQYKKKGFKGNEFIASTIVSTPMLRVMADAYGVAYKEVLTGFKWIAKLIQDNPDLTFIGGGEESYGFMVGDFVRDKDAVTSTLLACEIAAQAKAKGSSFFQHLQEMYEQYGYFKEHLISLVKKGISGAEEIKQILKNLRENPLKMINGSPVVLVEDYQTSKSHNLQDNTTSNIDLPKSNVLIYYTEDGSKVAARPSGTEPKIKFYISVQQAVEENDNLADVEKALDDRIESIKSELQFE
ncbi:phospho-sugar mutase [Portibacter lacus]|uniref:Phosphoglucomutase n=1 Tax=Portibacter lacus TaxID=1099794 RepID=A0AA37WBX7_9BACT|nr:phospho-sugar mutase [Portibacter lacus]GLR15448.1 phosphoglucomutase [Portibacter lacus]